ncbi:lysophospholipid acyltransferase family protein [Aerococcus agrisoli]|nr:lysophospholipid acyltransferase family protein [Aerococcus agrisoli]
MLYKILLGIIALIINVVNGPTRYEYDDDFDPSKTYLVIGPHRSLLDPIFVALALRPKQIAFIAKKELLANKFLTWFFTSINIIPVDRENPGPSTIKDAVRTLKEGDKYVGIFPTGSRYSDEIKPGAVSIAKMGKVELLPVNYQGPIEIKDIFSWKREDRAKVRVGKPIQIPDVKRLTEEDTLAVHQAIQDAFDANDRLIDPNYQYDMAAAIAKRDAKRAKKGK